MVDGREWVRDWVLEKKNKKSPQELSPLVYYYTTVDEQRRAG